MEKKVKNCEVLDDWAEGLPRKCYDNYEKVNVSEKWFDVYKLPFDVYCIYEGGHFQEVISYLICGEKGCILFDTGMGIGNIKRVVQEIADKKVIVVNSHMHFDHIGDNHRFGEVYIFDYQLAINRLKKGYSREELSQHADNGMIIRELPGGFKREEYHIPGCNPKEIGNEHRFDLGDRILEVIHTPGHSMESIMLHDITNQVLFTGDTFYPAALYAHFSGDFYGKSDFNVYMNTMDKLSKLSDNLKYLYCSHNEPIVSPKKLLECSRAFHEIDEGSAEFYMDEENHKRYDFDGFSIII